MVRRCDCIHADTCKYLAKIETLATENEMYGMFEYGEWNNILDLFANGVRCRYREKPLEDTK